MEMVSVIISLMNSKLTHFAAAALAVLAANLLAIAPIGSLGTAAQADTFKLGTQESNHLIPAEPIDCPQPVITEEIDRKSVV